MDDPLCPGCGKPYPYGDPRAVVGPPKVCFDCEGAGLGIPPVLDDSTIPDDATCQEASPFSGGRYLACGEPAVAIVYHEKDRRGYYMCASCTSHNVHNRGGKLLASRSRP